VWKYYEVCKQDVNTGQKWDTLKTDAKRRGSRENTVPSTASSLYKMLEIWKWKWKNVNIELGVEVNMNVYLKGN